MKPEDRLIHLIELQLGVLDRNQKMDAYRSLVAFCSGRLEKMICEGIDAEVIRGRCCCTKIPPKP